MVNAQSDFAFDLVTRRDLSHHERSIPVRFLSRGDLNFCINRDTPPPGTDHDRPAIIYTVICTRPPEAKRRNSYETEGARVGGGKS